MTRARHGEAGTAAVELSLFFVVLLALVALLAPLGTALAAKATAGRAAGAAARFATPVPDRPRPYVDPASAGSAGGRRPTSNEICNEAYRGVLPASTAPTTCGVTAPINPAGTNSSSITVTCAGCGTNRKPGVLVAVRITRVIDLSVFGAILRGAGLGTGSITVISTSQGRQE